MRTPPNAGLISFLALLPLVAVFEQDSPAPEGRRPVPATGGRVPPAATQPALGPAQAAGAPQPATKPAAAPLIAEMSFSTTTLDGRPLTVPFEFPGQLVVVHFWATWCPSCAREVPFWKEGYEKYHNRNVAFIGIPTDQNRGTPAEKVRAAIEQRGLAWPQAYDDAQTLSETYLVDTLPATFIIDGDTGRVLAQGDAIRLKNFAKTLDRLLAEREKSAAPQPARPPAPEQKPEKKTDGPPPAGKKP